MAIASEMKIKLKSPKRARSASPGRRTMAVQMPKNAAPSPAIAANCGALSSSIFADQNMADVSEAITRPAAMPISVSGATRHTRLVLCLLCGPPAGPAQEHFARPHNLPEQP